VQVEKTALRVLNELKPGRRLYTNVEFYAGVVMNSVGIPPEMFTPTFCIEPYGWLDRRDRGAGRQQQAHPPVRALRRSAAAATAARRIRRGNIERRARALTSG